MKQCCIEMFTTLIRKLVYFWRGVDPLLYYGPFSFELFERRICTPGETTISRFGYGNAHICSCEPCRFHISNSSCLAPIVCISKSGENIYEKTNGWSPNSWSPTCKHTREQSLFLIMRYFLIRLVLQQQND